ncbi:MAG TPA: hypothetical protein VI818_08225, partial [Candidatus Thermoplasmatota archaeon]|nr:hypothetical protein [Candidatus Thermoplasmatota archaeon]
LRIVVNETKMKAVAESSGIDCFESKCKVYTRVFAEANNTGIRLPGSSPDLGPLGKPPWRVDAAVVMDQKFMQYMTTFHNGPMPPQFTKLQDH